MAAKRSICSTLLLLIASNTTAETTLTEEKIKWALSTLYDLQEGQTAAIDALASVEKRLHDLENSVHAQLPTPNWIDCNRTPSLPQELYNQGATTLLVEMASFDSSQGCAKLVIDRHPVVLVSGGIDVPFAAIEVSNSKAVLVDIGTARLTSFNSEVIMSDSVADEASFENSNLLYSNSFILKGEATGSTIQVSLDFGGLGDFSLRRSDLAGSGGLASTNLVLLPGSTINFGEDVEAILPLTMGPGSTVTCDPEQSRIYDPLHRLQVNVQFYPPAYDEDSCLVQVPRPE